MIKITPAAAKQVKQSAQQTQAETLSLRIAARKESDGTFIYGMGFDEEGSDDARCESEGIRVLIANTCKELVDGMTVDFVEINPGEHQFIFINPNDPAHGPAAPSDGESP